MRIGLALEVQGAGVVTPSFADGIAVVNVQSPPISSAPLTTMVRSRENLRESGVGDGSSLGPGLTCVSV